MQKIDLNQLFGAGGGLPMGDTAVIGAQSAQDTNDEFASLLQCLQTGGPATPGDPSLVQQQVRLDVLAG